MTRKLAEWPFENGQTENVGPSDSCRANAVPLAAESKYDFCELGVYLGNVGFRLAHGRRRVVTEMIEGRRTAVKWFIGGTIVAAPGFSLLSLSGCASRKALSINNMIRVYYPEDVSDAKIKSFLEEAEKAHETLTEYLGVAERPVTINVGYYDWPRVGENFVVEFPKFILVRETYWNGLWHEMTHALTRTSGMFYAEGLAEFIMLKFSARFSQDIHPFVRKWYKEYGKEVLPSELVNTDVAITKPLLKKRIGYSVATSFIRYLIEEVSANDEKKFMEFYKAGDRSPAAYRKHFGKTLRELETGWINFIRSYGNAPKM